MQTPETPLRYPVDCRMPGRLIAVNDAVRHAKRGELPTDAAVAVAVAGPGVHKGS